MKKKKIKHLYRASTDDGFHTFTLEAENKKELIKKVEECGFEVKDWRLDKIY